MKGETKMKTPIVDDRTTNSKRLCDIEFGQHFILYVGNIERLCTRISTELKVDCVDCFEDELLVMDEETGELFSLVRDKLVEPVKTEIHIVG